MGGKKFTYFLAPSDQIGFEAALRASGDIALLSRLSKSVRPEEVPTSRVLAMGKETLDLWIARRADLPEIEFKPVGARGEFYCDQTFAPVIEFDRCYVTDRYIRAGRLYRVDKYWNANKQQVSKPEAFVEWANLLYKLAKKSLTKVEQGCYAGKEALELRKTGMAFEGLDIEIARVSGTQY